MSWFSSQRKAVATAAFKHEAQGHDLVLWLEKDRRRVPFAEWATARPDCLCGLAALQSAVEDPVERRAPLVRVGEDRITIEPELVARLDAPSAASLGLPAPTPLALDLKPRGLISDEDFRIEIRWVRPGGQPVRADVQGALISTADGLRRIPEPVWSLHRAAVQLNQPLERSERFRALAELRACWPTDAGVRVESDHYLSELRVHYASALSLKLRTLTPDRTDFDPVLFGARSVAEAEEEGRPADEDLDNVLTPAAQKLFAEDRFRREAEGRPVYVLRDGEYVFIDPALRPLLNSVRKLQDRPEAERRAFVLNPRKFLRERLGDTAEGLNLDALFVETEQFSSRVAGVDVWRAPVLPWLTPLGKNQWLPERFGLRIGDDYFVLPPNNAARLLEKLEAGAAAGVQTVAIPGLLESARSGGPPPPTEIAVNDQTIDAVRSLTPFAGGDHGVGGLAEDAPGPELYAAGKLFLVVRENFEEVEFAPVGVAEPSPRAVPAAEPPRRLRTTLKPHQLEGLRWLSQCIGLQRPGALLADDMGLGKTLQAIAFMAWLQEQAAAHGQAAPPFLIVAPTGLLGTWREEIVKHLDIPRLGPLVPAFGSDLRSLREESGLSAKDIETGAAALRSEAWSDAGVVLTTYETMRDYHFSFARTRFGLVIYDEIQKLKNPVSQMTRAAKALNAAFTLGMTGTPVENRLQDLWSIMDVIAPGLLGASRDFERRFPPDDPDALGGLKALLTGAGEDQAPYMLRRLKAEALEGLPGKRVHSFEMDMPPVQANAYRDLIVRAAAGASAGTMGKGGMLSTLAAMRGVSLHPLDPRQAPTDLEAYARDSARLSRTMSVLDDIATKREKALIFVEDLAMQERLAGLIKARFKLPSLPTRINGGVPGPKRQALVSAFEKNRTEFDVMILSPKAGGVGLTLTSANHVIHLSRWWNPAVEDQATDRVFRIGQTKDVHVHLPMAVHPDPEIRESSFDLRLNALIERKRKLTRDLFLPPEPSENDLAELFKEVSLSQEPSSPHGPGMIGHEVAAEPPPVPEPIVAEAAPATPTGTRKPVLTLPHAVQGAGVRYWRVSAGEARPTKDILEIFRDRDVVQVAIRDPYALGRAATRLAQVRFLSELSGVSRSLEAALIEYAPEVDGDLIEGAARREFGELFARAFPKNPPRLNLARRSKRSRDDDFHDRMIEVSVRHAGGAVRQHELAIGRGAEALYDERWQCTVTYVPPSSHK